MRNSTQNHSKSDLKRKKKKRKQQSKVKMQRMNQLVVCIEYKRLRLFVP